MFVGHTALALAAKSRARELSLGLLLAAAVGLDLLWPILLLAGIERVSIVPGITAFTPLRFDSYPWSHSLLMAAVWGALATVVLALRGARRGSALLVGLLVVSHWFLDVASHRPDMPLWPGRSPLVGSGLWNSIPATLLVEGALFAAGIAVYCRVTRARDRIGSWGLAALLFVQFAMWASGPFGPPPPGPRSLAAFSLGVWLFVWWAWWVDRHRVAAGEPARATSPRAAP